MPSYSKKFRDDLNNFLTKSANEYKTNLLDKEGYFMHQNSNSIEFLNVEFKDKNFAHLVGIKPNYGNGRITKSSDLLYNFLNAKTSNEVPILGRDYLLTHRADIIRAKMHASKSGLDVFKNARFVGNLNNELFVNLYSEKLAGDEVGVIGFVWDEDNYLPNTLLNADVQEISIEDTIREISATFVLDHNTQELDVSYLNADVELNSIIKMQQLVLENISMRGNNISEINMSDDLEKVNEIYAKEKSYRLPKPKSPADVFSNAKDRANELNNGKQLSVVSKQKHL